MLLDQRRERIRGRIEQQGYATLQELAESTGCSESTIRRDLEWLDKEGAIRRTRGGAAYIADSQPAFEDRRQRASEEKQRIGRATAQLIQPDETILLDGGTTTLEVARRLTDKSLQVVTNSLPIVQLLATAPAINVVLLGGCLHPKTGVALGPLTLGALERIKARRLILSAGGLTRDGLFNSNSLLVDAERAMIAAADEVIVVADAGKLGHSELAAVCGWDVIDRLVIDRLPGDDWLALWEQHGVRVLVAE